MTPHILSVPTPTGPLAVVLEPGTGVLLGTSLFGADDILGRLGLGPDDVVVDDGASTPAVTRVVDAFARYAAGEVTALEALEVRQPGGPFTQRAWEAMRKVRGVATYAELAASSGSPSAHRAAGRACAVNVIPVVVPCHRIVTADRTLGGYYFGLDHKRALLEHEGLLDQVRG
ncbi:ADA regulatory protein / Methylated-DNA--protein-cysteine methyltransferase [Actinomycetales bacterium JB111]|nr:ADA regulatory protein / Methylated-DNA--protein-cysteine methyltransferase [Actinomycetales bacterium JB111]